MSRDEVRAGVPLTNLDQPLLDVADATKRDLVDYLDAVRGRIIPALRDRPLSVVRGSAGRPEGVSRSGRRTRHPDHGQRHLDALADGMTEEEIIAEYPTLTVEAHPGGRRVRRRARPRRVPGRLVPMRIELDENLPESEAQLLRNDGHDVDPARAEALQGKHDSEVLQAAARADRLLVTLDRGLGDVRRYPHTGSNPVGGTRKALVSRLHEQCVGPHSRQYGSQLGRGRPRARASRAAPLPRITCLG